MDDYIEEFLDYCRLAKKTSENSISAYRHDLSKLFNYLKGCGITKISAVTFTDLNAFILKLEREGSADSSISRTVSSVKSFFNFLNVRRLREDNPAMGLRPPKPVRDIPKILDAGSVERLLAMPDLSAEMGIRDKAMLELLYATGMRTTELLSLKPEDVDLGLSCVRVEGNTGERYVPFDASAKEALELYLEKSRPFFMKKNSNLLFTNYNGEPMTRQGFWKLVKAYGMKAGLGNEVSPDVIRHSFGAHMVENGADLYTLKEILGYGDLSSVQIYSSFSRQKLSSVYADTHLRKNISEKEEG